MNNDNSYKQLLMHLSNLPLHLLLSILRYLDNETKTCITNDGNINGQDHQIFYNLVSLSLFSQKYITGTDRSVYLNFYGEEAFIKYQTNLLGEISIREPQKYFKIQKEIQQLIECIKAELKCFENGENMIQMINMQIRDPELPLPKMRKQGIAMYCNSSLQYGLVDIRFEGQDNEDDEFVEDYVWDFQEMLEALEETIDGILKDRIKEKKGCKGPLSIIKQCYCHPEILTIHNYKNYVIKSLVSFNMFVYLHALLSGVAEIYNEYIVDQGKEFQRFIEFQMRYSIYRSIVVALESSKLSKILYNAVAKLLEKAQEITENSNKLEKPPIVYEEETIIQASLESENRPSKGEEEIAYKQTISYRGLLRLPSDAKTQRTVQLSNTEMSGRLYLVSGKIWTNQSRKIKAINQETPSPSKYFTTISQEHVNTKSFIKILNRLSYLNILDKLQKQIEENSQYSSPDRNQGLSASPIRDQDILNIFGASQSSSDYEQIQSPTLQNHSTSVSQTSSLSPKSSSPYDSKRSFNQMLKSGGHLEQSSHYLTALMHIENKIRMQPYRFQKNKDSNDASSLSPEKESEFMPQVQLQTLIKLPSLRSKRLLSKTSVVSKFTKITEARTVSSVQQLIESDVSIQQQLLVQYNAYLMDLSVNEVNVHWCGHTDQVLMGDHFHQLEQYILKYNEGFLYYLLKVGEEACQKIENQHKNKSDSKCNLKYHTLINKLLKKLLQSHLQYMDIGLINKITLKKILTIANDWLAKACHRYKLQPEQIQLINLNLEESNKMLEHYNEKMWGIEKNVSQEKLKIYEQRKVARNKIQLIRCHQNESKHKNEGKRGQRKRRNSQQALILHNIQQ